MCLSKVYNKRNGDFELLLEEVASVEIGQDRLTFKTLFGEQKEMEGSIKRIDFLTHSILLESPGAK